MAQTARDKALRQIFSDAKARVDRRSQGAGALKDVVGPRLYRALLAEELLSAAVQGARFAEDADTLKTVLAESWAWLNKVAPS